MDFESFEGRYLQQEKALEVAVYFDQDTNKCPRVRGEFKEEMAKVAHWMAKQAAGGGPRVNEPLKCILKKLFEAVRFETCVTTTPLENGRKNNMIFLLHGRNEFYERRSRIDKLPLKWRIDFVRGNNGDLLIPVEGAHIPLVLTEESIQTILLPVGRKVSEAFHQGSVELRQKKPTRSRRALLEEDRTELALRELQEHLSPSSEKFSRFLAPFNTESDLEPREGDSVEKLRGKKRLMRRRDRITTVRGSVVQLRV